MEASKYPVQVFDGVRARPTSGRVDLLHDRLVLLPESGEQVEWNITEIRSIHRVADEIHVELPGREGHGPSVKLVAKDRRFEQALDEHRARFLMDLKPDVTARLRRMGVRGWLLVAAVVLPLCWWLYTLLLPQAHVFISKEAEASLGGYVHDSLVAQWQVIEDEGFAELTGRMLRELRDPATDYDLRVTLVDQPVPNALAAPGGYIIVFSGLLEMCDDPDMLAAVLAHEVVHVEQRHGLKQMLRSLGLLFFASFVIGGGVEEFATAEAIAEMSSGLLILQHAREHEREADRLGVAKLKRAGRRADGLAAFFAAVEKRSPSSAELSWLHTHPLSTERIQEVSRRAGPSHGSSRPWMSDEEWQALRQRILR